MLWIQIKRMFRTGFINFWRDGIISLASVLVMTITLFTLGFIIFSGAILKASLLELQNKVDINVYFVPDAPESEILLLERSIKALPEVKETEYVSRDQALSDFESRHENDQLTLQALQELGYNPFGASINVRAKETSQYESIAKFLEGKNALSSAESRIVEKINYNQNKSAIQRLTKIIDASQKLGAAITVILGLISILITFNTIRLAIYTYRDEIGVMRLVGASRRYIRGPFVVAGVMYGLAAGLMAMVVYYPVSLWLGRATENFFGGLNVADYYVNHFFEIFLILVGAGVMLGAISSYLAVRKYLNV